MGLIGCVRDPSLLLPPRAGSLRSPDVAIHAEKTEQIRELLTLYAGVRWARGVVHAWLVLLRHGWASETTLKGLRGRRLAALSCPAEG